MCHGGVGSILVMFDVLDYYILYMCLLLFVYCIVYLFWRLPGQGGRQNMIFLKKSLCSSVGVDVVGRVCHVAVMFVGEPTNIRPMWHRGGCGTTWRTFVGQVEPTNIRVLGSSVLHGRRM
jgi:hypothetical protein